MIVVKLKGGLGNQLFEYATARRASFVNHTDLKLDTSSYLPTSGRKYSLQHFKISGEIATSESIDWFKPPIGKSLGGLIRRILKLFTPYYKRHYLLERRKFLDRFDKNILKVGKDVYLQGYWHSEKYFEDIKPILLEELVLKNELSQKAADTAKMIISCNSVSIHVRRGDFVTDKLNNEKYDPCSKEYYESAMGYIESTYAEPTFFMFSDDILWAKENIKSKRPTVYVSNSLIEDYEELVLMALCKHNIIANSSFSWWGAWLNRNPQKTVIAPKNWFNTPHRITDDLLPKSWIQL
ncbi:MAG: alpha-1,2-fucosyltransferase [bacterium]|nr:alpha-1,2-fucosyltransferase [bacterium]